MMCRERAPLEVSPLRPIAAVHATCNLPWCRPSPAGPVVSATRHTALSPPAQPQPLSRLASPRSSSEHPQKQGWTGGIVGCMCIHAAGLASICIACRLPLDVERLSPHHQLHVAWLKDGDQNNAGCQPGYGFMPTLWTWGP